MAIVAGQQALAADVVDGKSLKTGMIIIWTGTTATIPDGFLICDGNNSTPNLLTRFIEGVATAATNPGTTGGATNKTTAGHLHYYGDADVNGWEVAGTKYRTDNKTDTIADIRPLYYDVAFIMKS